jgi:hypothetical protein
MACGARNYSFYFRDGTTEVIPVTREGPAREWLRGRFIVAFCRYATLLLHFVATLCCCSFCRSAALREGLRRKELFFLIFETVRLKSYPVTCGWSAKRVVARTVYCCFFCRSATLLLLIMSLRYAVALFVAPLPLRLRSGFRPAASS